MEKEARSVASVLSPAPALRSHGGRLSRRALATGLVGPVAGSLALFAAACGAPQSTAPESQTKKPVHITYLLHNATKMGVDQKHLPEYKDKNPHVTVEFAQVPDADLTAKITSLFAAGSSPEIFNPSSSPSTGMIDRGWAAEIAYKAIGLGSAQKFVDAYASSTPVDGYKWKGKYYGLPTEVSNYCLFINNRLFRKAGLDPQKDYPKDWDQMIEVATKLTVRDGGQITQRGFEPDYGRPTYPWGLPFAQIARVGGWWPRRAGGTYQADSRAGGAGVAGAGRGASGGEGRRWGCAGG